MVKANERAGKSHVTGKARELLEEDRRRRQAAREEKEQHQQICMKILEGYPYAKF